MSGFSYPPPPPPPPPPPQPPAGPSSNSHHSRSSQKIPTFQSRNGGHPRKHDGRGGHQGGRGPNNRQSNAHLHPPSGGNLPRSHVNQPTGPPLPNPPVQNRIGHQGQYGAGQTYSASTPPSWSGPQYPGAGPYGNPYASPVSSHPSQQYYSQAPIPGPPYMSHAPAYPAPIVSAYQPPAFPYPPPPPAPATPAQHTRLGFEDRQGSGTRAQNSHHRSPDSGHGHKRKREQSPHRMQGRPGSSGQPPNKVRGGQSFSQRPKVKAAPAVPSFGFHGLPPKPPSTLTSAPPRAPSAKEPREREGRKKQKKRKTNQLGLTPKGDVHEASDDDIDEEAKYAASGASVTIQHKGKTVSVSTPDEIQAWIAERKKKFPTEARVAEKKALQEKRKKEAEERRKQASEEQTKAQKAKKQEQPSRKKAKQRNKKVGDVKSELPSKDEEAKQAGSSLSKDAEGRARRKLEQHLRKAERLRELLAQAEIKDEPTESMADASVKIEPEAGAANPSSEGRKQQLDDNPSSASDKSSDSDSESSAAPEVSSIKAGPDFVKMESQPKLAAKVGRNNYTDVPCKYFVRDGHCRRKNCRFLHVIPRKSGRMTLFERLKEGEMHERSLQTLELIKRLGQQGLFDH